MPRKRPKQRQEGGELDGRPLGPQPDPCSVIQADLERFQAAPDLTARPKYLRGDQITATEVRWLWPGIVPRGLPTVFYGPLLSGKSTVLRSLAAAVSTGRAPTGKGKAPPGTVVWLAGEEPIEQVVIPSLVAAGADLGRFLFPQRPAAGGVRGWRLLEQGQDFTALVWAARAELVVIDPVACFLGGEHPPESNLAARLTLGYLTQLGAETGAASAIIKHPRKSGRGSPLEQMSGGLEWMNTPRSVVLCAPHPLKQDTRVIHQQKPSLCEVGVGMEFQVEKKDGRGVCLWLRDSELSAAELLADELSAPDRSALEEAREFLTTYLSESERRTTDLQKWAQEAGLSWPTVRRAKTELKVGSHWHIEDGQRHRVWRMPEKGGS